MIAGGQQTAGRTGAGQASAPGRSWRAGPKAICPRGPRWAMFMHLQQLSAPSGLNANVPCETSVIPERLPMSLREAPASRSDQRDARHRRLALPIFIEGWLAGYL